MPLLWQSGLSNQRYLMLGYIPVKGPDMVRGLSAGKHDYIVTNNYKIQILIVKTDFGSLFV